MRRMTCICIRSPISMGDDSYGAKVARLRLCDSPLSGPLGASGLYRNWPLTVPEVDDDDEVSSSGKCWPERLPPIAWSMCARGSTPQWLNEKEKAL
jgi:hypothetical protein